MDDDTRELANRLFAAATATLGDAIGVAATGQSAHAGPAELAAHARQIQATGRNIAALAEAVLIVTRTHPENR